MANDHNFAYKFKWVLSLKKQNNQNNKPRKKGLGIEKLEKILKEEKHREENKMVVAEFSSRLLSSLLLQYQPPSFSFLYPMGAAPQPPMEMMSLISPTNTLSPTPTFFPVLYGNAGLNSTHGVDGGGGGDGGNGGFAEQAAGRHRMWLFCQNL